MKFKLFPVFLVWSVFTYGNEYNPFYLDTVTFDQQNFSFKVKWHIDPGSDSNNYNPGITFTCSEESSSPPLSCLNQLSGDSVFELPDLIFDTTYYIELWAKHNDTWIEPDSQSTKKVKVFSLVHQPVTLFETSTTDTVKALKGKLMMFIDSTFPLGLPPYNDTVSSFIPAKSMLKDGFVGYSNAIRFQKPEPIAPFFIAITPDSIPKKDFRKEQLRIFRDSSGVFLCEKESYYDKDIDRVIVKTKNLKFPFVILADTARPKIKIVSDTSECIKSRSLHDTLEIEDNCANINWSYYCSPGAQLPVIPEKSGTFQKKKGLITGMIPSPGAQSDGMRAVYIINDGTYSDTIRLSRRGLRENCDPFTTAANIITPFFTTSTLEKSEMKNGLNDLFKKAGGKYDKSLFRIYRWYPDKSNKSKENKWIEYSSKNQSLFKITSGVLFWLITDKPYLINLGKGTSVSLIDTIKVILQPKQWTDFSNPYGFNLSLANIMKSSGNISEEITVYKWARDNNNKTYRAELFYDNAVSEFHDTVHALEYGYTVFNKSDSVINLSLAPIPFQSQYSESYLHKKQPIKNQTICVSLSGNRGKYASVYCGIHYNGDDTLFSALPPSFGTTPIRIKKGDSSYGILSCPVQKNTLPAVFELEIYANGMHDIQLSADLMDKTSDLSYLLFYHDNNKSKGFSGNHVSVDNTLNKAYLVAGSKADIESFQKQHNSKPVQSKPSVCINYCNNSISLQIHGIEKSLLSLKLFSLDGKTVKTHSLKYSGIAAPELKLPVNLQNGVYIAKVVFKRKGTNIYSKVHKITNFKKR